MRVLLLNRQLNIVNKSQIPRVPAHNHKGCAGRDLRSLRARGILLMRENRLVVAPDEPTKTKLLEK
jgi:hypothetical protein